MDTYNLLKQTDHYQKSNSIRKTMLSKLDNVEKVTHGINMTKNVGFEKWVTSFSPSFDNQQIVKEILETLP